MIIIKNQKKTHLFIDLFIMLISYIFMIHIQYIEFYNINLSFNIINTTIQTQTYHIFILY